MSESAAHIEPFSFWSLLERYRIEIPIIQRDYAQGREGKEQLRKQFLETLHMAVSKKPQELDFIYGYIIRSDTFLPLDGQQRLTTLFLLHCYAAKKNGNPSKEELERLKKFTYETRVSSRDFCSYFVSEKVEIDWSAEMISPAIRDCPWFFSSWEKDPSVRGMLRMLDDIHRKFGQSADLWASLTRPGDPAIGFRFIQLNDFGLSDDLYIKMNARGRPLTPFENFKALMEKRIETEKWDHHRSDREHFSIKADTVWTDLFWKETKDSFDRAFFNFFIQSLVCSIAGNNENLNQKSERIAGLLSNPEKLSPEMFGKDEYENLYAELDNFTDSNIKIKLPDIRFWEIIKEDTLLFSDLLTNPGPQYKKRILFFAQSLFLRKGINDLNAYSDWIRVVRNIIQNSRTDGVDEFIGAIALINEIEAGIGDIYTFLGCSQIKSKFAAEQVAEEIRKSKLISEQPEIKSILHSLEDNLFFQGRISFALYCVCEDEAAIMIDQDALSKALLVFERDFGDGINDNLRRALLNILDGNYFKYWSSWLYAVNLPKYCLIENNGEFRNLANNKNSRHYLKELVKRLEDESLLEVINTPCENTPKWRIRVIKEPELLEFAKQKYIALSDDESKCYLIPRKRVASSQEGCNRLIDISCLTDICATEGVQ